MDQEMQSTRTQAEEPLQEPEPVKIDIQALAEEIYRLLKRELALEKERRGL